MGESDEQNRETKAHREQKASPWSRGRIGGMKLIAQRLVILNASTQTGKLRLRIKND